MEALRAADVLKVPDRAKEGEGKGKRQRVAEGTNSFPGLHGDNVEYGNSNAGQHQR